LVVIGKYAKVKTLEIPVATETEALCLRHSIPHTDLRFPDLTGVS
jgi:hypothetical protein